MRLFKKDLKSRGLSIKALISFFEDVKKGIYVKKDKSEALQGSPSKVAYIYKSELDFISRCILDYKNIETGGQLFGYWTADGSPVIVFALGPGPNANHEVAFFLQDLEYLKTRAELLCKKYGLFHIGEWHSHHQLGLAQPSGHDANNLYSNIVKLGYSRFLLCIGNCTQNDSSLNAFMFYNGSQSYEKTPWILKDIESPFRKVICDENPKFFTEPDMSVGKMVGLYTVNTPHDSKSASYKAHYWLTSKENRKILKSIIDSLNQSNLNTDYILTLDDNDEVHISCYKGEDIIEDIHFPLEFPFDPPIIILNGRQLYSNSKWQFKKDIYNSFFNYYNKIKII